MPSLTEKRQTTGKRWQLSVVLMVSLMVSYFDRMNISFALPMIAKDYGWTVAETGSYGGLLMSVFFIGYGIANIFLSPIGEKFGPKKSLMTIVVLFTLFACLQAPFGMVLSAFIAIRVLLGLGEGIHAPMMSVLTKRWFPLNERSRANSIWFCGIFVAMLLSPVIVVPLTEAIGWRLMFVVIGLAGIFITLPLFKKFIYDSPEEHPHISKQEIEYIRQGQEGEGEEDSGINFRQNLSILLKRKVYWLVVFIGILNNMVAFGLLTWMPTFFTEGRNLSFNDLIYATSLPYVFSIIGALFWAYLGDKTNRRGVISGFAFLGAGLSIYLAAQASSIPLIITAFSFAIFFGTSFNANEWAFVQRVLPRNRIATGSGIYNGIAMMLGGGFGPILVGGIVSATGSYTNGIISLSVICFICSITLFILGRILKY